MSPHVAHSLSLACGHGVSPHRQTGVHLSKASRSASSAVVASSFFSSHACLRCATPAAATSRAGTGQ
eukprot:CAMPEP_0183341222 /NCGR_PEP_ID=MMETSP0164_2-20130417/7498_1 /TAXON_ID=221442 /ORGANISM="Coccolithus pelagicus ssp braarudi, Strain PLY182g" /LENGTH=66 /DNA_ID=CAMNT_0025511475 /DNA_START=298 /DNA_END=495 /DNA_ORIENTATION=+